MCNKVIAIRLYIRKVGSALLLRTGAITISLLKHEGEAEFA